MYFGPGQLFYLNRYLTFYYNCIILIMMDKTVLQIPVSKNLRIRAESTALEYGFSSLQEAVRVFLAKLAQKAIEISFQETIRLSPTADSRYQKMDADFAAGKNIYFGETVKELKDQLSG